MRAICLTLCVLGCDEDMCGKLTSQMNKVTDAAPNKLISVEITNCSTCAHAMATGTWTAPAGMTVTGNVQIQVFPECFVSHTTENRPVTAGETASFTSDFNAKNCGDVVGYNVTIDNQTNVTLTSMIVSLSCNVM